MMIGAVYTDKGAGNDNRSCTGDKAFQRRSEQENVDIFIYMRMLITLNVFGKASRKCPKASSASVTNLCNSQSVRETKDAILRLCYCTKDL